MCGKRFDRLSPMPVTRARPPTEAECRCRRRDQRLVRATQRVGVGAEPRPTCRTAVAASVEPPPRPPPWGMRLSIVDVGEATVAEGERTRDEVGAVGRARRRRRGRSRLCGESRPGWIVIVIRTSWRSRLTISASMRWKPSSRRPVTCSERGELGAARAMTRWRSRPMVSSRRSATCDERCSNEPTRRRRVLRGAPSVPTTCGGLELFGLDHDPLSETCAASCGAGRRPVFTSVEELRASRLLRDDPASDRDG